MLDSNAIFDMSNESRYEPQRFSHILLVELKSFNRNFQLRGGSMLELSNSLGY